MNVAMEEEIKDIKPPIRLFNYLFIIYILIALVVLVIGYFIENISRTNRSPKSNQW
jgi:hypothetical protein